MSFRDRRDGKRLKDLNGMSYILYHLKKKRSYREVYMNYPVDVTELIKYMEKVNKKSENHITYFHLFATAIAKVFYNRPYLNRFIVNGHFYQRNNVSLAYVAKMEFNDDSEEVMRVLKVKKDDNIFSISKKIAGYVKEARTSTETFTDSFVDRIGKGPKPIRALVVAIFKFLDRHDLLPKDMTDEIIYFSSAILSNIGSIGSPCSIYHNITDFGTNSCLVTMGKIYKKEVINDKNEKEIRSFCDFGITLDEGIADGFYMIKSVELLDYIIKNPKLLEGAANEKISIK